MKILLLIFAVSAAFVMGVLAAPRFSSIPALNTIDVPALLKSVDYWADRYQTFLGVLVAVVIAYLTIGAMGQQNAISERQFFSGQMQGLMNDRATLQLVIAQLSEISSQKTLFENNIAFLDPEGDKTTGWQNGVNLIRTAYSNIEGFRNLVSANTAKFMSSDSSRALLIAKLDELVSSHELMRESFLAWALTNRMANADPTAPPSAPKAQYFQTKKQIIALFGEVRSLAKKCVEEIGNSVRRNDEDILGMQRAIDSKL